MTVNSPVHHVTNLIYLLKDTVFALLVWVSVFIVDLYRSVQSIRQIEDFLQRVLRNLLSALNAKRSHAKLLGVLAIDKSSV